MKRYTSVGGLSALGIISGLLAWFFGARYHKQLLVLQVPLDPATGQPGLKHGPGPEAQDHFGRLHNLMWAFTVIAIVLVCVSFCLFLNKVLRRPPNP